MIKLFNGDALDVMDKLIEKGIKVDAIITDPPYGTTACSWDSVIPFDEMWKRLNIIMKSNGTIALFGSEPFSSALRMSNIEMFKYDWIWEKSQGANFALVKHQPYKVHEIISVFYNDLSKTTYSTKAFKELRRYFKDLLNYIGLPKSKIVNDVGGRADHCFRSDSSQWCIPSEETYNILINKYNIDKYKGFKTYSELNLIYEDELKSFKKTYNYITTDGKKYISGKGHSGETTGNFKKTQTINNGKRFPRSIQKFAQNKTISFHPTQKPVELMEYLIRTYTNEGELVLDFTMGSGTTLVACKQLNRNGIGIELNEDYFKIAQQRVDEAVEGSSLNKDVE